jgi:hypothetical protein
MDSPPLRLYDPADEHNKYKRARGPTRRCAAGAEEENEREKNKSGRSRRSMRGNMRLGVCACLHMGEVETLTASGIQEHISHAADPGRLYFTSWSIKHQHCARTASASKLFSRIFIAPRHKKMHEDKCERTHCADC